MSTIDPATSLARPSAFHVMTKPVGPICNIDCRYCFYLEKESLYGDARHAWRMPDAVLERYIQQYIQRQESPQITFAWQGGEPTLLGVRFFQRVVELQRQHANGKRIDNAIQTNGLLLDDAWGQFLADEKFLVGLSLDGPRDLHDLYRVDLKGNGTFDGVMRGRDVLRKHGVEFNTLTVVHRQNSRRPMDVYRFLKEAGSGYVQFIPLVERAPTTGVALTVGGRPAPRRENHLAGPPAGAIDPAVAVTEWSLLPADYGSFLCTIFDHWVRHDVGRVFVQLFDTALGKWLGGGAERGGLCFFAETCGDALAMEHNGDVYSCDHYVYPQYKLGNLMDAELDALVASPQQRKFGADKRDTLPAYCRSCDVRFACHGECPKHRFATTPDGEPGLNYLCAAYKRFFHHADPHLRRMADLLRAGQPAARVMELFAPRVGPGAVGRNDPCPCGSGKKFKRCCGTP